MQTTQSSDINRSYPLEKLLIILGLLTFLVLATRRAWLGDDAFISLRVVNNFVDGHGLVYNLGERVQVFTHPLWLFLLSVGYFLTREPYFTTIAISLLCSLAAVAVVVKMSPSRWAAFLALLILSLSNAFVDYATSGLENPLTYLLIALFFFFYFKFPVPTSRQLFLLSMIASLAAVNRLDTFAFFLFPLLTLWLQAFRKKQALLWLAAGQWPILLWELFSIIYYGFPFPNTYYAKLGTGIPAGELVSQGLYYFLNSLKKDPLTLIVIFAVLLFLILTIKEKRWRLLSAGLGILLYLAYILKIGGDFMSGRFFAAPLLVAVILLTHMEIDFNVQKEYRWLLVGAVLLLGLSTDMPSFQIENKDVLDIEPYTRIADERIYYAPTTGLLNQSRMNETPFGWLREQGEEYRLFIQSTDEYFIKEYSMGLHGFFAGSDAYMIDVYALTDPLRARLPMSYQTTWRIGHFLRIDEIPGYKETINSGKNKIEDKQLAKYYDRLSLIIHGPIWNLTRFKTILKMNLGSYDSYIDTFYYRYSEVKQLKYEEAPHDFLAGSCSDKGISPFGIHGLLFKIPAALQQGTQVVLGISNNQRYQVLFYDDDRTELGRVILNPTGQDGVALPYTLDVPQAAVEHGYTEIHLLPLSKADNYCFSSIKILP